MRFDGDAWKDRMKEYKINVVEEKRREERKIDEQVKRCMRVMKCCIAVPDSGRRLGEEYIYLYSNTIFPSATTSLWLALSACQCHCWLDTMLEPVVCKRYISNSTSKLRSGDPIHGICWSYGTR